MLIPNLIKSDRALLFNLALFAFDSVEVSTIFPKRIVCIVILVSSENSSWVITGNKLGSSNYHIIFLLIQLKSGNFYFLN